MQYPLNLSFKIITLIPQIYITDATGMSVLYTRQKLLKLKEEVTIFADPDQNQPLYKINADRILDWSARYHFKNIGGNELGSVKRAGMKSLWSAHYEIFDGQSHIMTIREENPLIKFLDGIFSGIPVLGLFSGYVLHPVYNVTDDRIGRVVMQLKKQPSFFEGKFSIEKADGLKEQEEKVALLSLLMMVLLERQRG